MVYGFAQQSSGDARIESVMGQGTTVSLFLPLSHDQAITTGVSEPAELGRDLQVDNVSILVVDDETAIRDLIGEALEEVGYQVTKAGTAAQALQELEQAPETVLLITDIVLPAGMNGDELAVAALAIRPTLKVLFISGFVENTVPAIALKSGQTELLQKPFAVNALKSMIQRLLAKG